MTDSIFSNAFNFQESISTGVDVRTGDYSVSIALGNLFSAMTSGLSYSLMLGYSASSNVDSGFGRGWGILTSRFNKHDNKLSLSSGQSFYIEWDFDKNEYTIPYRRVNDIRVMRDFDLGKIIVLHKDGRKETLDYEEGYLEEVVSSNGIPIKFEYKLFNFEYQLSRIYDDFGQEIEINFRSNEWVTYVTHKLAGNAVRNIVFDKFGGGDFKRLRTISIENALSIRFEYRYVETGYDLIEKVIHPTGMVEEMSYLDQGHSMPQGAPISKVPFITTHVTRVGENQPDRTVRYDFSDQNYLGFASDQAWVAGEDTLFKARSDYRYSTTETINATHVIHREYNKYHLLEKASYELNGERYKLENNTYFADLNVSIENQPPIYTFLKYAEVTFFKDGGERKVINSYEYDVYGNEVLAISPDSSRVVTEYYNADGEPGCPAHPYGFGAFIKQETFIPNTLNEDAPRSKKYTYQSAQKLNNYDGYMVLLSKLETHDSSETFEYYLNENSPLTYGRVKQELTRVNGFDSITNYSYDFFDGKLKTTQELVSFDGHKTLNHETVRCSDGLQIEVAQSVDLNNHQNSNVTELAYDVLGRLVTQITAKGSNNEALILTEYSVGDGKNFVQSTDKKGNSQKQQYNNAGNLISVSILDEGGTLREIKSSTYNAFGLVENETETDWLDGSVFLSNTTHFEYDNFGQVSKVKHSDGREEFITQNPVSLTSVFRINGLIQEETTFDVSGNEISKKTLDSGGNLLVSSLKKYDGYSNLIETIDTDNNVTRISYDNSDRMISVTKYIDGQELVTKFDYADFSLAELPRSVHLNDHLMGEKQYDGFGRITRESSAKFSQSKSYENDNTIPSVVKNSNGELRIEHNKFLQSPELVQVYSNRGASIQQSYSYDAITGSPRELQSNDCYSLINYNLMGQLISETNVIKGEEKKANYKYTLLGLLREKSDFFGSSELYDYDQFGRLSEIHTSMGNSVSTNEIIYDKFSRPFKYIYRSDGQEVIIELEFNDVGLELYRSTEINGLGVICENYTEYNTSLQIKEKIYRDYFSGSQNTTVERMEYDDLHRLTNYTSEGPNSPQNELGLTVIEQSYKYDIYGNIIESVTRFNDQSVNIAKFTFDSNHPVILEKVTNSHPLIDDINLEYDGAGNIISDSSGFRYSYNALNQLVSMQDSEGYQSSFIYDPTGVLAQQNSSEGQVNYRYQSGKLINESSGDNFATYNWIDGVMNNRKVSHGSEVMSQVLILDNQNSVVGQIKNEDGRADYKKISYTPYGECADD